MYVIFHKLNGNISITGVSQTDGNKYTTVTRTLGTNGIIGCIAHRNGLNRSTIGTHIPNTSVCIKGSAIRNNFAGVNPGVAAALIRKRKKGGKRSEERGLVYRINR